jgi:hypothetical protein
MKSREGGEKLRNEELRNLNSSPSIIRMIESRRMRWAGHIARIGENKNTYRLFVGNPEGRRPLGKPRRRRVDTIKLDLRQDGVVRPGLVLLRIGTSGEICECGNEPSGSTKCWET